MGLFSNLFGDKNNKQSEQSKVYYAKPERAIEDATKHAQETFKYFWREVYWEYRRIVSGHDFAMVKVPFSQEIEGQNEPVVEHMWLNDIHFDGDKVTGVLVNQPNDLTNLEKDAKVEIKVSEISDWMIAIQGKTLGGFTIQLMRSQMSNKERKQHDKAWGLDFGDFNDIQVVHKQKELPDNLVEHPMSLNMEVKLREFLTENPDEITHIDEQGLTMLHTEAIAGNKTSISVLIEFGVDKTVTCKSGKTALDYAQQMKWDHLYDLLS